MSEKRFVLCKKGDVEYIEDNCCVQLYGFDVLCEMLNEQQATIRRLQDLCGESDSENAKLRIENKELQEEIKLLKPVNVEQYEQIVQLQEENEQLRKQCFELEKDYLIETSDISDKIYLDDEIKELKQKYGVKDE